jgi:hypothetical protein
VPELALLAALMAGLGTSFNSWRQSAYPDDVPAWVTWVQLGFVVGFLVVLVAAVATMVGIVNLSWLAPLAWYAVPAALAVALGIIAYKNRSAIASVFGARKRVNTGRIAFLALKDIAEKEYGWDFGPHSDMILGFANGVRQAHLDGAFVVEGRPGCAEMPETMKLNYPLLPVPDLLHWWIDPLPASNWEIHTYTFDDPDYRRASHRDIHIGAEAAARRWLERDANAYKTPQPTVDAEKALIHITHPSDAGTPMRAKMEFERAAERGILNVWGKTIVNGQPAALGPIRPSYWEHAELDLTTFILYAAPKGFPEQYNHTNHTSQAGRPKPGAQRRVDDHESLRVNAKQVLSIWPKTRKGSPLELVKDKSY